MSGERPFGKTMPSWRIGRATLILFAAAALSSCAIELQAPPSPPAVARLGDLLFVVVAPVRYSIRDTKVSISAPVGLLTDLASIPRSLWWFESPIDRSMAAAVLHDYLYWDQRCSKDEADAVLYLAMAESKVAWKVRAGVYAGVRTPIADSAWSRNATVRAAGERRYLKPDYLFSLLEGPADPGATMSSVQSTATTSGGLTDVEHSNPDLKAACAVALKAFTAKGGVMG